MTQHRRLLATILGLVLLCCIGPRPAPAAESELWQSLREGAVVLFRHANAPGTGDPPGFRIDDCATQRNLSDQGRRQAVAIGDRFRAEEVTVSTVLSSQWCRAFDTASLAFPGLVKREPAFNSFFGDRSLEPQQTERARQIILAWRGPGALVVVTHQVNIIALTGIAPSEGEGIVLRNDGGEVRVVGRIRSTAEF